jgi:hypothetical protein
LDAKITSICLSFLPLRNTGEAGKDHKKQPWKKHKPGKDASPLLPAKREEEEGGGGDVGAA